jgi:hypothetical protein
LKGDGERGLLSGSGGELETGVVRRAVHSLVE